MKDQLQLNEYYFVANNSGHYLKTKNKEEFDEVRNWDTIIFAGVIKNNQFLHYKIAGNWKKKPFMRLQTSAPLDVGAFDFHLIQHELSSNISEIKVGGKEKPVNYEML